MKSSLKAQISIKKILLKKAKYDYEKYISLGDKYPVSDRNRAHYLALASRVLSAITSYEKEIIFLENEELV